MQGNIFVILQGLFDFFCLFLSRSRFKFVCRVRDPLRDLLNLPTTSRLCSQPAIIFSGFSKHFRDFLDYFFVSPLDRVLVRDLPCDLANIVATLGNIFVPSNPIFGPE